ncbi:MAG: hypothetical protein OXR73_07090, partial [Myxococcales bacterium]|nr:hypothetical protein [Myxococcales bacterium]
LGDPFLSTLLQEGSVRQKIGLGHGPFGSAFVALACPKISAAIVDLEDLQRCLRRKLFEHGAATQEWA